MAESLGVLTLDMVARTVDFDRPIQKSEQIAAKSGSAIVGSIAKIEKQSEQTGKAVTALGGMIKGSIAAISVGSMVKIADEYAQTAARISNATKSVAEYDMVQQHLFETANGTFRSLKEAQEVYLATSGALEELGFTTAQILAISDSLSYSFVHNATNADSASGAMDAYGKILAKGKVEADAWFSLLNGADNILNDVASATGKTTQEIRKLGAEGKISVADLNKGLLLSVDANKALADSMVNSAADGAQKLSNAVSRVVGEFNRTSGATAVFADGLSVVADNIDVVSAGMLIGGAYMVGSYVPAIGKSIAAGYLKVTQLTEQTAVQMSAIAVERTAAASTLAQAQAQVVNTQATLTSIAAERALEVERLKSQISAQGRMASSTRLAQLGRIEAQVKRELAVATAMETAAQERSNIAKASSLGVGRSVLGVLGGPVGLGLVVATVAAGYLMMRDSGDKTNSMLESQSRYAGMAADELSRLDGAKRKAAEDDLSKEVDILNNKLKASENQFEAVVEKVLDSNKANKEANKIWSELRAGAIGVDDAYSRLNKTDFVTSDQINQLSDSKKKVDESKLAIKTANEQLDKVKSSGENAKQGFSDVGQGAQDAAGKVFALNEKLLAYNKSLTDRKWDAEFKAAIISGHGKSAQEAELLLEAYRKNQAEGLSGISIEQKKLISGIVQQEDALSKLTGQEKNRTSELEKQQKVLSVNAEVMRLASKYNISAKESAAGLPNGLISSMIMQESKGNKNAVGPLTKSGEHARGLAQFMPGTAKQYKVNVNSEESSINGMVAYMKDLLKKYDGNVDKAVMAYNAGPGNVDTGKAYSFKETKDYLEKIKGYMAGIAGFKTGEVSSKDFERLLGDYTKMAEQQAQSQKQLQLAVADEVTQIRSKLADDLKEIDQAGYSPDRTNALKVEYVARADNEISVAQQALKTKVDAFADYLKTEEQLLQDSYAVRQFEVRHDLQLTKADREKAVNHLSAQMNQELALVKLSQEERRFQMSETLMDANSRSEKYWDLERKRIELNVTDLVERNRQLAISNALEAEEKRTNLKSATDNYGSIHAEMTATRGGYDLSQERFSRLDASQDLFDSQITLAETAEERELVWQAHHDRMNMIESDYQAKSIGLQAGYVSSFAGLMQGLVSNTSSAYAILGGVQKGAALFSTAMNSYTAISAAWAFAPFPYNLGAVATATMETGLLQAAVSALSPTGYATGGRITGPGTGTSDDVPIMASNGEFMMRYSASQKIGLATLNYMNRYGELPQSNALTPKVGNGFAGRDVKNIQAAPNVNLNPNFVIVDERENLGDYLFSPDGTKAFVKFFKRNRSALGV